MLYIDNQAIEFGEFPNGESNLNFNRFSFARCSQIKLKYESDKDLFNLYILKSYIDSLFPVNEITLTILYMPYSRMDRENDYYTFNLKYVANFINQMKFKRVSILDPHSDVTSALIDRCETQSVIDILFMKFRKHYKRNIQILFPDATAKKRYEHIIQGYPTLFGLKNRDFKTGEITDYQLIGAIDNSADVVIVDDLCSKGGTFVGAAKAFGNFSGRFFLIVPHCENTILNGEVGNCFTKVYTTDSIFSDNLPLPEYIDITTLIGRI